MLTANICSMVFPLVLGWAPQNSPKKEYWLYNYFENGSIILSENFNLEFLCLNMDLDHIFISKRRQWQTSLTASSIFYRSSQCSNWARKWIKRAFKDSSTVLSVGWWFSFRVRHYSGKAMHGSMLFLIETIWWCFTLLKQHQVLLLQWRHIQLQLWTG